MTHYILDTNLLFNMGGSMGLGENTKDIVSHLHTALKKAEFEQIFACIPPSIAQEIATFFENPQDPILLNFLDVVRIESPRTAELSLPASVVGALIEDHRERSYRGMKVAEEELVNTATQCMGKEVLPHKEFQIFTGKTIAKMRERFRTATRTGTIDSVADFDLIMLARSLDGFLVSTDEGVMKWAREMGTKELSSVSFGNKMQAYL